MEEHNNKNINRRDFLKIVGISAATTTAAATLYSCKQKDGTIPGGSASTPVPTDQMTYPRPLYQAKKPYFTTCSYGCIRWPAMPSPDGKFRRISPIRCREQVVDYAISLVEYFNKKSMPAIWCRNGRRSNRHRTANVSQVGSW